MFKDVLEKFLLACQDDSVLKEFASRRTIGLHFLISDKNQEFLLAFKNGAVVTAMGTPSEKADLIIRTTAETFDGMMTGRLDGATAYMTGKLRFTGDTTKGMTLQRLIKDMVRLYNQAHSQVADPLD